MALQCGRAGEDGQDGTSQGQVTAGHVALEQM